MNENRNTEVDDSALPPDEMLALLDDQQRAIEGKVASFVPAIVAAWGVVWLFGFGALWLVDGLRPGFGLPLPVAATIFAVLLAAAIALSAVLGIRSSRGIRGDSAQAYTGVVYGVTWMIGAAVVIGLGLGMWANGMPADLVNIYYPSAFVLFSGIMYVVAAAIWRATPMLILGLWVIVVGIAAPFFGYPALYLVLALGGGIGFLVLAVASFTYLARLRARVTRGAYRG